MDFGQTFYQATAAVNKVISAKPTRLIRIIVGEDVGSSTIECSNSKDDGDGDVQVFLSGSTLIGVYEINADFPDGLTVDIVNQTKVTFVHKAIGS